MKNVENYDELYEFIDRVLKININVKNFNLKYLKNVLKYRVYTMLIHDKEIKYIIRKFDFNIAIEVIRKLYYKLLIKNRREDEN